MYLNLTCLDWDFGRTEGSGVYNDRFYRAHNIWRHAKDRLSDPCSEFDRVDCISSLKRSINSRLKALNYEYNIESLPSPRNKKQLLQKFQDYGLIRPTFLKDLFELRNLIEHEDIDAPSVEKCNYYIDIVWYFLKSTDSLFDLKVECISYEDEFNNEVSLQINPESGWEVAILGKIDKKLLSEHQSTDCIEIKDITVNPFKNDLDKIKFSGTPIITEHLLTKIARDYFGAAGFWYEDHI